jgi:succinyl-CoA synthetase alpha subunit
MAIFVDRDTKVLVQGITGHQGTFHTQQMLSFGTKVVAGVTPGKGGSAVEGVPVFNSISEAVAATRANTSIIFVPAPFTKDAVFEAADAGIKLVICITEHIPLQDSMQVMQYAKLNGVVVIGPNTPGLIAPPVKVKIGIMPTAIFKPGKVGVISRSGTLTYEIVNALSEGGWGQSTCVGLGGDRVVGLDYTDVLERFERDGETDAVVMIGEIGGSAEEDACAYISKMKKPVVAYIAGQTAPPEKRMGHAGAIISRGVGTAAGKIKALTDAGVKVAKVPTQVAELLASVKKR